jgi:hypothetical protein
MIFLIQHLLRRIYWLTAKKYKMVAEIFAFLPWFKRFWVFVIFQVTKILFSSLLCLVICRIKYWYLRISQKNTICEEIISTCVSLDWNDFLKPSNVCPKLSLTLWNCCSKRNEIVTKYIPTYFSQNCIFHTLLNTFPKNKNFFDFLFTFLFDFFFFFFFLHNPKLTALEQRVSTVAINIYIEQNWKKN